MNASDNAPRITPRLDMIGLVVADMAASLAFYRRLGIDLPPAADDAPHTETTLPGGLRVAWDTVETVRSFDPSWSPATGSRVSLAFDCGSPEGVDAVYAALTEAGHPGHLKPWDAFWGQRYAVVHDPDGNAVDLFAASA
jgi:catechol 2,3-dioxygenase-like lactoylglutathione lyase family enzyme